LEFQDETNCTLNTLQARKAFCALYKDRLYKLALDLTHDPKRACNLVVTAFQHAFHKYSARPCPDDCFPFLSASVYLMLATEGGADDLFPDHPDSGAEPGFSAESETACPGAEPFQAGRYASSAAGRAREFPDLDWQSEPAWPGEEPVRPHADAGFASSGPDRARSGGAPRHARTAQPDSSQPLNQQVFDPEHTEYWTPGMEQAQTSATIVETPPDLSGPSGAAPDGRSASAASAQVFSQQPNVSQAYMYNAEVARKRKSAPLSILNIFLGLLFLWMLVGLLARMDVLPEWNLGYAWFNLNIFPLF